MQVTVEPSLFHTTATFGRQQALIQAGAVGVIEILEQPGNMQSFDGDRHGCGSDLCFTVGGEDGFFLRNVLNAAARSNTTVTAALSARSSVVPKAQTGNVVATIPGRSKRAIIVNAHADAFFSGADDNGTGLAALVALARYFRTQPKLERTLVFVASAGHHNNLNGLRDFRIRHEADILANTDLVLNLEHIAAGGLSRSAKFQQGQPRNFNFEMVTGSDASMKMASVNNGAPFIVNLYREGVACFDLNLGREVTRNNPGELGALAGVDAVQTQMIYAGPLYHTSGEAVGAISRTELERSTRFFAHFIRQVASAPKAALTGAPTPSPKRCPAVP